jgi:hypothetical protein
VFWSVMTAILMVSLVIFAVFYKGQAAEAE